MFNFRKQNDDVTDLIKCVQTMRRIHVRADVILLLISAIFSVFSIEMTIENNALLQFANLLAFKRRIEAQINNLERCCSNWKIL